MCGLAQEVQLEINTTLLGPLDSLEHNDWGEFGKVRIAIEKRLRDPDDVFIHAEERRKELARQGRKSRRVPRRGQYSVQKKSTTKAMP
jgi:hypothetical protein